MNGATRQARGWSRSARWRALCGAFRGGACGAGVVAVLHLAGAPATAVAQGSGWGGDSERVHFEGRLDFLAARTNAVHKMIGLHTPLGTYGRFAALVGGGLRGVDGDWKESGRVDAVARFHVDPFLQSRRAVYAGAGLSVLVDPGRAPRPRMLVVVGVEGPRSRAGWIVSGELGIGGGVRASLVWRRTPPGAR